ncbi:MAG: four helix bundle protein [Gemmatimonadetes bacterium]|nr:four helix bundle protein [Gemmatimonadota bacterium]
MHHYQQLDVWRRGLTLAAELHRHARSARPSWSDRSLWDQITRAATSVPANVAEGALRGGDREFARFLSIAMASAAELHSLLMLAGESELLSPDTAARWCDEAVALRKMTAALRARATGARPR